ncbi:MAG TPA: VWA domain-containing protein [Thermoanaerobaculia bacterium]
MTCTREMNRRSLGAALIVLTCLAQPSPAQEEAEGPVTDEVFQEQIGIEVVNVDVVVTDKKGRAVEGLTREDFELRIDGRLVEIANFYAVTGAEATPAPAPAVEEDAAPPDAAAPRDPVHVVVYFDSFYLTPISRKRVLEDLPAFFERQIADGARILLAVHLQDLKVMSEFTDDLDELRSALARIAEAPAAGLQQTTGHRLTLDGLRDIYKVCEDSPILEPCLDCFEQMVGLARSFGAGALAERRGAVAALNDVVNALSVLEGRKSVLHVSDGIQQHPGIDFFHYIGEQLCPQRRGDLTEYYLHQDVEDLKDVVARANASRVTFYALEAAGVRNFSSASAEYGDHFFKPSGENDMIRIANLQSTLHYLSAETGGKAILNASAYAADLDKLAGELRTYYSLGYQPEHPGRGRSHYVRVKVPKKNAEVRYRRTFLHKKPDQQLADRALGAVFFGAGANPLSATVEVRTTRPGEAGRVVVPLEIAVPLARLVLLPHADARRGRMTVVVAAPDEKNDEIAIRRKDIPVSLALGATPAEDDVWRFGVNVELMPGTYQLGVGIWDEVGAAGSFLNVPVEAALASAGEGGATE